MQNHWIEESCLITRHEYRRKIFEAWRDRCIYCGREATTLDHLIPRSSPDSTELTSNLAPACLSCNRAKGNKDLEEWYRSRHEFSNDRLFWILEWQRQPWVK